MKKTFFEEFLSDEENLRIYCQEGLIVEFAEMVVELMEQRKLKKKDIAKQLGVSASQVTQWLDGTANLQLRTMSDILFALNSKLKIEAKPLKEKYAFGVENIKDNWLRTGGSLYGQYGSSHLKYVPITDSEKKIAG